jgi:hypothetical protein
MSAHGLASTVAACYRAQVVDPVDAELSVGDPRSQEHRTGMLDAYAFHQLRTPTPSLRYPLGTAQADTYFSGRERGHALWRRLHNPNPTNQSQEQS